jgi:hypothetical protein
LKNGVASLAYAPAIHHFLKKMDARIKSAHDGRDSVKSRKPLTSYAKKDMDGQDEPGHGE